MSSPSPSASPEPVEPQARRDSYSPTKRARVLSPLFDDEEVEDDEALTIAIFGSLHNEPEAEQAGTTASSPAGVSPPKHLKIRSLTLPLRSLQDPPDILPANAPASVSSPITNNISSSTSAQQLAPILEDGEVAIDLPQGLLCLIACALVRTTRLLGPRSVSQLWTRRWNARVTVYALLPSLYIECEVCQTSTVPAFSRPTRAFVGVRKPHRRQLLEVTRLARFAYIL